MYLEYNENDDLATRFKVSQENWFRWMEELFNEVEKPLPDGRVRVLENYTKLAEEK